MYNYSKLKKKKIAINYLRELIGAYINIKVIQYLKI